MSEDARLITSETPADPTATLPSDPAFLQQMIIELLAALRETRRQNEELQHRLDLLLRRLYGPRTERFDPNQPLLIPDAFEPLAPESEPSVTGDAVAPEPEPGAAPAKKTRSHGRRPLPKNLRREPRGYELTEAERRCPQCGETRAQISAERSEQLDYVPATLFVVEHVRCTYACPHCEGQVVTAGKPAQPIPKGLPGPGLLAHVITEKYADHIPLHRQERRLARQGVELSRSTLCDWMAGAAQSLEPLYDLMKTLVLLCGTIHTDDTSVKLRDSERKIKALARLWIYFGDYLYPYNVFDFTRSHKRDGPSLFLKGFRGYLQADAFSGYDGIYAGGNVVEVGCNAHARRKFVEAQKTDLTRASTALAYYRQLYAIEKQIKTELAKLPEDANEPTRAAIRLRVRQERAVPVWESLEKWLKEERPQVLPKSPMGGAIGYMKNHWEALKLYTSSGYLSIDHNVAEQHMKTIATGRKNWLFTGSETGGKTMAVLFSVVSSCQRHGHDPFVYLRDVLSRLPVLPKENLSDLLPDRWSPPQAADPAATPEGPIADGSPS
ncbi:IS66 family transposase [Singulisphaera sp. Ch08]|uniref:IS66 family transposase n=1 Tax=Singulisphaera sp. Ch08 TaxID=3120278 RepID=A0AAU7CL97_9BACT